MNFKSISTLSDFDLSMCIVHELFAHTFVSRPLFEQFALSLSRVQTQCPVDTAVGPACSGCTQTIS